MLWNKTYQYTRMCLGTHSKYFSVFFITYWLKYFQKVPNWTQSHIDEYCIKFTLFRIVKYNQWVCKWYFLVGIYSRPLSIRVIGFLYQVRFITVVLLTSIKLMIGNLMRRGGSGSSCGRPASTTFYRHFLQQSFKPRYEENNETFCLFSWLQIEFSEVSIHREGI